MFRLSRNAELGITLEAIQDQVVLALRKDLATSSTAIGRLVTLDKQLKAKAFQIIDTLGSSRLASWRYTIQPSNFRPVSVKELPATRVSSWKNQRAGLAIENYVQAIALDPYSVQFHFNLAGAHDKLQEYDQAIEEHKTTIRLDPEFYGAYSQLARLYILRGQYSNALHLLNRVFPIIASQNRNPKDLYQCVTYKGWAMLCLKNYAQAADLLDWAGGRCNRDGEVWQIGNVNT